MKNAHSSIFLYAKVLLTNQSNHAYAVLLCVRIFYMYLPNNTFVGIGTRSEHWLCIYAYEAGKIRAVRNIGQWLAPPGVFCVSAIKYNEISSYAYLLYLCVMIWWHIEKITEPNFASDQQTGMECSLLVIDLCVYVHLAGAINARIHEQGDNKNRLMWLPNR